MSRFLRSTFLAFLFLALVAPFSHSEAQIPIKVRISNQTPGYCAWASLETVCRHQGVRAGYDLLEKRKLDPDLITWYGEPLPKNLGYDWAVEAKLKNLGIKYKINHTGDRTKAGLKLIVDAVDAGCGAVVGVFTAPSCKGAGAHAIVITDLNSKKFEYIDSNTPKEEWVGDTDWFLQQWTGFVVVIK